jgi:hypothetical protein
LKFDALNRSKQIISPLSLGAKAAEKTLVLKKVSLQKT